MELEILRKLGLSEGEIKVYGALLELGASALNGIHERTGIERRNIYDILNKLIERGIVTYVQENKKRFFRIAHPNNIIGYIRQQEHELESTKGEILKHIPELVAKYEFKRQPMSGEIFRGHEGTKAVWEDMLNYKEIKWIGAGRYIPKQMPHFFASWNKRRIEKKIPILNIVRQELRKEIKEPFKLETIRYQPKEWSGNPTVISLYGNKVVNFIFIGEFFAFVIESPELADHYRRYFDYLWQHVCTK